MWEVATGFVAKGLEGPEKESLLDALVDCLAMIHLTMQTLLVFIFV